ncbi:hypothetical protein [Microbacterium sp.]|uniref:hypothetical protein n=1 Tax=Microbacterium sp. TaxID=51671 RepID=UPI00333EC2D1
MLRRLGTPLFWLLLAALAVANAVVVWQSLTVLRLWEDEAFNLTVPRNLLAGLGYASDGALSGSTITPFDPRISTGPVVLLPIALLTALGLDPVLAGRLVPAVFWVLLLAGLWLLGRQIGGRWAGLAAAALPLAFNTAAGVSPILGPADVLGEIPAASLLVWALLVLPRRAWLAGLLLGLALQAKLIALLALPAFAVALLVLGPGRGRARWLGALRRCLLPLALAAAPTVLFEFAALLSLGFPGYLDHLRNLKAFLLSGGQHFVPTTPTEKLTALSQAWFSPGWTIVLAVAVVLIGGVVVAVSSRSPEGAAPARERAELHAIAWGAAVGLLAFVGWWAQASHLPVWVRHPAVGVFAFAPVLAAVGVRAAQSLWRRGGARRPLAALTAAAVAAPLLYGGAIHAQHGIEPIRGEGLASQRAAAAPLASWVAEHDADWLAARPWGSAVVFVFLSGAHVGLFDAPTMKRTPVLTGLDCPGEVLVRSGGLKICAP